MAAPSDTESFDVRQLVPIPYDLEEDDLEANRSQQQQQRINSGSGVSSSTASSSSSGASSMRNGSSSSGSSSSSSSGSASHQREFSSQTDTTKRGYIVRSFWNHFADYVNERANLWMRVAMLIVGWCPLFCLFCFLQ